MSQVRKTTFITLAFILSAGVLSGCGISGPLYAPGSGDDASKEQQSAVVTQTPDSADANVSKTQNGEVE